MSSPTERVLSALRDRGCEPRQTSSGWSARCPSHEDRNPSLSIAESETGTVLLKCHTGCSSAAVAEALGLKTSDLFVSTRRQSTKPHKARAKRGFVDKAPPETFEIADDAIASLERRRGPATSRWVYTDSAGEPVGYVLRWNLAAGGKTVRPVSRGVDGRWSVTGMPSPRPLYCLPEVLEADLVYVTEGEKTAEAVRSLGLAATTSPHGSKSADKADWSPLAGKQVVLLPDHDEAGETYAADVTKALGNLTPPPDVRIVRLPDLPAAGDAFDWLEGRDVDAARRELKALVSAAEVLHFEPRDDVTKLIFQPFPCEHLPHSARELAKAAATSIGCDPAFIALPMLSVLASAVGNTRTARLRAGWDEPCCLWTAVVAESGTAKTPAFSVAVKPLENLQAGALEAHEQAMRFHAQELLCYEKALAAWKKDKSDSAPPRRPEEPVATRYIAGDTTTEALVSLLSGNPRGLLVARDELSGWIGSFDRYSNGNGDEAHWLSMHNAGRVTVDRKTGTPRTITVHRGLVSLCGGIQPAVLRRTMGQQHRESGLLARLLLCSPPRQRKRWSEAGIDPHLERQYARLVERLHSLQSDDSSGRPEPVPLPLSAESREVWRTFYDTHAAELAEAAGHWASFLAKLEGAAARIALLLQLATWADGARAEPPREIGVDAMQSAISLSNWFKHEASRTYALLDEADADRDHRHLLEWIARQDGPVTARDVARGMRSIENSDAAEQALAALEEAGFGRWEAAEPGDQGGRPTRVFRLNGGQLSTKPPEPRAKRGFVDSRQVDAAENKEVLI